MINSKYFFLLIFAGHFFFASAQDEEEKTDGRAMINLGAGYTDFGNLNDVLEANAYPALDNMGWDWGISLWLSDERLNFIYDFGTHSRKAEGVNTTNYDAGEFAISFGYSLVKREHLSIVPYLGLGFEYGRLELIQKEDPNVNTVSGYIADTPRSQDMDMWGLLGSMGVYALWDFSSKSDKSNFTLGLHGGYTPRLMKQQWKSAGGEKLDGISVPGGVSANLVFGVAL